MTDTKAQDITNYPTGDTGIFLTNSLKTNASSSPKRRVSTAHIEPQGLPPPPAGHTNNNANHFAYDELVSTCADFLGSSVVNDTVTHFADSILAVIGSPTTLDSAEVKRRLEQVLPQSHAFKHYRGMSLSDKDCTLLCSLADRVLYSPTTSSMGNLNIVDDEAKEDDGMRAGHNNVVVGGGGGSVHYIRHPSKPQTVLPKHLPNFVEPNAELGEGVSVEYDMDVTPYDSEAENDPPIRMKA